MTKSPTPLRPRAHEWQAPVDPEGQLHRAAEALGIALSTTQAQQLLKYQALLLRWNKVYNLTAVRSPAEALTHHLVDCLAALAPLKRQLASLASADPTTPKAAETPKPSASAKAAALTDGISTAGHPSILDVGSGGGLPGVVFAIMQPDWQIDCVDTVAKKVGFIRQAALELQLPRLKALHARVEELAAPTHGYQVITSRAFASLADFTRLTRGQLAPKGCWMAMKAQLSAEERQGLPADVEVFHVEQLQVPGLNAERCLVWMRPKPSHP